MVGAGYCPVAEAVEWADGVIAREVAPPAAVLDVSLTGRASRQRSGRSASHCMPSPMLLY